MCVKRLQYTPSRSHGISIYYTFVNEVFRVILFLETIDMFTQEVISDATENKLNLLADLHETIL